MNESLQNHNAPIYNVCDSLHVYMYMYTPYMYMCMYTPHEIFVYYNRKVWENSHIHQLYEYDTTEVP